MFGFPTGDLNPIGNAPMLGAHKSVEGTGANRFAQRQIKRHRWLAPVAALDHIECMSQFPETFSSESGEVPEDVRLAFLEILYYTLLCVRSGANKQAVCFAHSDHAHNIPHFVGKPKPELLQFYWEVERPLFLRKMQELTETVSVFEPSWKIIEQECETLKTRAVV